MLKKTLLAAFLGLTLSSPVQAQEVQNICTDRSEVLGHLATKYSEAPVAMGLANNGGVIEVLASGTGNSWTIIITMPNGVSCMLAAGESWESLPVVKTGPDI